MRSTAVFLFIALPWINPFSSGPAAAVVPWLVTLGCFAFVVLLAARVALADVAASAWLTAALISATFGLLQYFGATAPFASLINSTELGEAFANLRQRNQFATLTNMGLAAVLWWGVRRPRPPALWLAAAALLAAGNAASSSRTGLVQLGLVVGLSLLWGDWRRPATRQVLAVSVLSYAAAAVALPWLAGLNPQSSGIVAHLQDGNSVCASRLTLWSNVLHLIAQKPWFGWGWGELDFAHFITLYPGARFCDILDNAHNLPLHLAVELGLPLAVALCAAGLWLVWHAKPWRETQPARQLAWSVLALIMLHSMLEYPLWYGPFQVAFGLSVWLLWCASAARTSAASGGAVKSGVAAALTAVLLLAATAYAAWDYHRISQIYLSPQMRSGNYRSDTLSKISSSWLFRDSVRFAELTTTTLTPDNAAHIHQLATQMLHFSPEARTVEKLIDAAVLLGREDEAKFYRLRYQAAFPDSYAQWKLLHP